MLDHFWQQRIVREVNAASRFVDRQSGVTSPFGATSKNALSPSSSKVGPNYFISPHVQPDVDRASVTAEGLKNSNDHMNNNPSYKEEAHHQHDQAFSQTMPRPTSKQSVNGKNPRKIQVKTFKKSLTEGPNKDPLLSNGKSSRFNEELEFIVKKGSSTKSIISSASTKVLTMTPPTKITVHRPSSKNINIRKSIYKDQIIDTINKLSEPELEQLRKTLRIGDIQSPSFRSSQDNIDQGNGRSFRPSYISPEELNALESVSYRPLSIITSPSNASSHRTYSIKTSDSMRSTLTYINALEKKLEIEQHAREKLEKEVRDLKKISTQLTTALSTIQPAKK